MAWPSYTLTQIITLAQQRADMVNSDFAGSDELRRYVTDSVGSLSDFLISIQGGRQWTLKHDLSFTSAITENGVVIRANFYKLLRVGLKWPQTGTTERIIWLDPLDDAVEREVKATDWSVTRPRYMLSRDSSNTDPTAPTTVQEFYLSLFPLTTSTWSVRVEYFPAWRFDNDSHTMNFPFPDFVILDVASKLAVKEQNTELLGMLQAERAEVEKRIQRWSAPLDRHAPGFLSDVQGDLDLEPNHGSGWR